MTDRIFTAREKLAEVSREAALRRRVYPRFVAAGRLSQAKADEQIACMDAIANDYRAAAAAEKAASDAEAAKGRLL